MGMSGTCFLIRIQYNYSLSEPYFYTSATRINRLIPPLLRNVLDAHEYYVAAIWNDVTITEIYLLSLDSSSDEMETLESLSQSFMQS